MIFRKAELVLHGRHDDVDSLDPFQMSSDDWIDDISRWPFVEFGEIYIYLIDTPDSSLKRR